MRELCECRAGAKPRRFYRAVAFIIVKPMDIVLGKRTALSDFHPAAIFHF